MRVRFFGIILAWAGTVLIASAYNSQNTLDIVLGSASFIIGFHFAISD